MTSPLKNPESNKLKAGLTVEKVEAAIRVSGYPLQVAVSALLHPSFTVQQEWAYSDRTTGETRTIDVLAEGRLSTEDPNKYRVRPTLVLLIECKQSDLPYVFFLAEKVTPPKFPLIAGLPSDTLTIRTDDDRSTWNLSMLMALELAFHKFLTETPVCSTFSKCVRKGNAVELSGSDPYNQLVMPLMSAMHHFKTRAQPRTPYYFEAYLVLCVAVLDAPMIGVDVGQGDQLEFIPWVRILRHEPKVQQEFFAHAGDLFAIDVVHKDFFVAYLKEHLWPFAEDFKEAAHRHHEELATSKGFISGMGENHWQELETRLKPRKPSPPPPPVRIPPKQKRNRSKRSK